MVKICVRFHYHTNLLTELDVESGVNGVVADVLGYDLLHLTDSSHVVVLLADGDEFVDVAANLLVIVLADSGYAYLLVERGLCVLVGGKEFLVEFLAGTKASVLDLDILGTAEQNHALGKVGNADGLAHVEHEDLAAFAHDACLENEFTGLGDEHEVANDVGIGDGDGTAFLDLTFKERNDGTIGTQHIAETSGDELTGSLTKRGWFKSS